MVAIQVSSVGSETAFSTSGRILDHLCSCLTPYMIEALVCNQQWLRNSISAEKLASLTQMFEELDFHESLGNRLGILLFILISHVFSLAFESLSHYAETLTIPEELNN